MSPGMDNGMQIILQIDLQKKITSDFPSKWLISIYYKNEGNGNQNNI